MVGKLRKQHIWLFSLSISFIVFVILLPLARDAIRESIQIVFAEPDMTQVNFITQNTLTVLGTGISFLASVVSLIGLISTNIISWRKEKRESRHKDLELEKLTLEVQKLKADANAKPPKNKNKKSKA